MPIVQAVGVAVSTALSGGETSRAKRIEKAMSDAVLLAHADGVVAPEDIKARMLAARDAVKE